MKNENETGKTNFFHEQRKKKTKIKLIEERTVNIRTKSFQQLSPVLTTPHF